MTRKELNQEMFPANRRGSWHDYLWNFLLFGTVGSGVVVGIGYGAGWRLPFLLYTFGVGVCVMAVWLIGWVIYTLLRALFRLLSGGVS